MPTLSPGQKQALSGFLMAIGTAAATAVEQAIANPPVTLHSVIVAVGMGSLLGLVHYLPALGTADVVQAKAEAIATEAVSREN